MGSETSKDSGSSHGWSNHSQPYTTDVAAFEAEQIKMREISRMDQTIRNRLHQGVKYNMKVLLCGERGTGKTMLWRRLQGQPFSYELESTAEIQSATINWTSPLANRTSAGKDDVVKVEVWDVVDHAMVVDKTTSESVAAEMVYNLTGEAEEGRHAIVPLDASIVDIYKDSHAVIFMVNPFDLKSLQYVRDKYPRVPSHLSILLLLNFKDKTTQIPHHPSPTLITLSQMQEMCAEIRSFRSNCANDDVTVLETSLLDCYGLLNLHHYLDVPFLRLKQRILLEQLASVESDLLLCHTDMERKTNNANSYEEYMRQYNARKRERMKQQGDSENKAISESTAVLNNAQSVPAVPSVEHVLHAQNVPPVPPVVIPSHSDYPITSTTSTSANIHPPIHDEHKHTETLTLPASKASPTALAPPSIHTQAVVSVSVADTSDTPNPTHQISAPNSTTTTSSSTKYEGSVAPYVPSPYSDGDISVTPTPTTSNVPTVKPEVNAPVVPDITGSVVQENASDSVAVSEKLINRAVSHSLSYSDEENQNTTNNNVSDTNNGTIEHQSTNTSTVNPNPINTTTTEAEVEGKEAEEHNPVSRGASPFSPVDTSAFEVPPSAEGSAQLDSFLAQDEEDVEVNTIDLGKNGDGEVRTDGVGAKDVVSDTHHNVTISRPADVVEKEGFDSDAEGMPTSPSTRPNNSNTTNSRFSHTSLKKDPSDSDSDDENGVERGNAKLNQKVNFGGKLLRSVRSSTVRSPSNSAGVNNNSSSGSGGLRKARPSANKAVKDRDDGDSSVSKTVLSGATELEEVDL